MQKKGKNNIKQYQMTANQLFEELRPNLLRINASEKNFNFYKEIQFSLKSIDIIDHFHQIKKNDNGEGLAFEIMFFTKDNIFDIVITRNNIDFITVQTSSVNMTYIEVNSGESKNENGELLIIDILKLTISYGGDFRHLVYKTDLKRFAEINRIKNNLTNTLNL